MQALTEQQIDEAAKAARVTAMGQPNWIGTDRHWGDIEEHYKQEWRDAVMAAAPHLQYAPAPVDGKLGHYLNCPGLIDCDDCDCGLIYRKQIQVLQSRHDAELAEYKKALGPVTDEEWPYQEHAPVDLPRLAAPYITRQYADAIFEHRRALLEKKPEPTLKDKFVASLYRIRGDQDEPTNAELADELLLFVERRSKA